MDNTGYDIPFIICCFCVIIRFKIAKSGCWALPQPPHPGLGAAVHPLRGARAGAVPPVCDATRPRRVRASAGDAHPRSLLRAHPPSAAPPPAGVPAGSGRRYRRLG